MSEIRIGMGWKSNLQMQPDPRLSASYDAVSIAFHWITLCLVVMIFALTLFPGVVKGSIALHKSLGLLVLAIVPLRMAWRLSKGRKPQAAAAEPFILRLAATGAHFALYALLLITPVLGWLYVDAKGVEVSAFGFDVPIIAYYDREFAWAVYAWKKWSAYSLLGLILVHAAAAVGYHSFIRKDGVLRSMWPRSTDRSRTDVADPLAPLPHRQ
jgi:cytochrome b561